MAALAELGYPNDGLSSKALHEVPLTEMDVVVSLIGDEGLRFLPSNLGATLESWSIRDPYGEDEEVYLASARTIEKHIKALLRQLDERELTVP
jgi:protein-tyrosine-phosphatase